MGVMSGMKSEPQMKQNWSLVEWNGDHKWNRIGTTSGIELGPQVEWNWDHEWNRMWIIGILSSLEPMFFTDL